EEVLGELPPRLSAPVHVPELVHVEIAGARAALEGRFARLDHLPPVTMGLVRTVANAASSFIVRDQLLVRQPQLSVLVMKQQDARREAVCLREVHALENLFRRRAPDDAAHDDLELRLLRKQLELLTQGL